MRLQEAGEGDHGVEAADIGRLDRTRDAEAPADRVAHNGIDCLSRGYARCPERPGLTKCCELNAVADEAGNFLVDHNWLLADAPDQLDGPGKDGRARLRPGADLDQWDELRRIPEVGRNHTIARPDTGDQGARRLAARRAEDGRGRTVAVEFFKDRVLQGEILRHRLDHEGRLAGIGEAHRCPDATEHCVRMVDQQPMGGELREASADVVGRLGEARWITPNHDHRVARGGENLGDSVPDDAIADDGDGDATGGHGCDLQDERWRSP